MSNPINKTSADLAPMSGLNADERYGEIDPRHIDIGERDRPINPDAVDEIAESIRLTGQLQPILVTYYDGKRYLIAGAHRVMACRKLNIKVQFVSFKSNFVKQEDWEPYLKVMEMDENLVRVDIPPAERDRMLGIRVENRKLISKLGSGKSTPVRNGKSTPKPRGNAASAKWFTEAYEGVGMKKDTAINRWKAYLESTDQKHRAPGKATEKQKDAFAQYLKGNAEKAQEEAEEAAWEEQLAEQSEALETIESACHDYLEAGGFSDALLEHIESVIQDFKSEN